MIGRGALLEIIDSASKSLGLNMDLSGRDPTDDYTFGEVVAGFMRQARKQGFD